MNDPTDDGALREMFNHDCFHWGGQSKIVKAPGRKDASLWRHVDVTDPVGMLSGCEHVPARRQL